MKRIRQCPETHSPCRAYPPGEIADPPPVQFVGSSLARRRNMHEHDTGPHARGVAALQAVPPVLQGMPVLAVVGDKAAGDLAADLARHLRPL